MSLAGWHQKNVIFSYLKNNPDATPHEVINYMIDMGYRKWVPSRGQARVYIRMFRSIHGYDEDEEE